MIKHNSETHQEVHFAQSSEKASISLGVKDNKLILQELAKDLKVGDEVKNGDYKELPKIELNFYTERSIDGMIAALQSIKSNMKSIPMWHLAC